MDKHLPEQSARERSMVARPVVHGAWIGAVLGLALSLLLRALLGPPERFLLKAVVIIGIVAAFGAFVGVLIEIRSRRRASTV